MKGGLSRIETGKQFTSELPRGLCEQVRFRLPRLGFIIDAKAIDYHQVGAGHVVVQFLGQALQAEPWLVLRPRPPQAWIAGRRQHLVSTQLHRVANALPIRTLLRLQTSQVIEHADSHGGYAADPFLVGHPIRLGVLSNKFCNKAFGLEGFFQLLDRFRMRFIVTDMYQ